MSAADDDAGTSAVPGSWWREGVLYQIYPRSFADSNGDGIGDLRGILARLDHLEWLGVDAIWLNPTMPSPNEDWGYDVADYCDVHPDLGTLEDLDALVAAARERGIRVLLDLVPNHTSDRHPWFRDALSGRDARYRDFYVWAPPSPDGGPPNNWVSNFGGSAWTLHEPTG
jgi:alpha-glucosidase